MTGTILVVSDEFNHRVKIVEELRSLGYRLVEAETGIRALEIIRKIDNVLLCFVDIEIFDIGCAELVEQIRQVNPYTAIIMMYDQELVEPYRIASMKQSIDMGAEVILPYNGNGLQLETLVSLLSKYKMLRRESDYNLILVDHVTTFDDFVTNSESMKKCISQIKNAIEQNKTIFLWGESGTGRRRLAKAICNAVHKGPDSDLSIIYCNSWLIDNKTDEEIFEQTKSLIESNVYKAFCIMDADILPKSKKHILSELLKLIKDKKNIIFGSNSQYLGWGDIGEMKSLFKKNEYESINVPPLRHRREDIEAIAQTIVNKLVLKMGMKSKVSGLAGAAVSLLNHDRWAGNITELEKVLYMAILISEGPLLKVKDFPRLSGEGLSGGLFSKESKQIDKFYKEDGHIKTLDSIEDEVIKSAIERYNGSLSEVARRLKIGRSTLYRKLERQEEQTVSLGK